MNATWNIANRIFLLRVSQTLIPEVRLSAFGGPNAYAASRMTPRVDAFHVSSTDHIENTFRHDAPRRRLVTFIGLARHTAAPARNTTARRHSADVPSFPFLSLLPPYLPSPLRPYTLIKILKIYQTYFLKCLL